MAVSNTNVKSSKRGRGVVENIVVSAKLERFIVCTMDIPWNLTKDVIGGVPEAVVMVESMEENVLERQLLSLPECDAFVGIGGGQAVDMAKYFSWKLGKRLVTIPTVISVDAFVTPAVGVRRGNEVVYIGDTSPDPLVIDYDLIRSAPCELNIAGVGDLLSIHTAVYDWELAHRLGKSEYPFLSDAVAQAKDILTNIMSKLEDIANVTDNGIAAIVDGYLNVNKICIPAGHYRVEEGSEHYVFYALEKKYQRSFIHGHIVGLSVYLMSRLQKNEVDKITKFMDTIGLCYHPVHMDITEEALKEVLLSLREFVQCRKDLWFTVINETEFSPKVVDELIKGLKFAY